MIRDQINGQRKGPEKKKHMVWFVYIRHCVICDLMSYLADLCWHQILSNCTIFEMIVLFSSFLCPIGQPCVDIPFWMCGGWTQCVLVCESWCVWVLCHSVTCLSQWQVTRLVCHSDKLTLRKIVIWMSKMPKTWHFFKKKCQWQFFWKKWKFLAIFLKKYVKFLAIFWHSNGNFPEGQVRVRELGRLSMCTLS